VLTPVSASFRKGSRSFTSKPARLAPQLGALDLTLLLILLMLPPLRQALKPGMRLRMLVKHPALMLAGSLLVRGLPPAMGRTLSNWNALGITGLTAVVLFMAVLIIPRLFDHSHSR
jgi:hypothetical protein